MRALFLGEGDLSGPARYLAAILTWSKISFDHRSDQARIPKPWRRRQYDVVILSDYRYRSFTPCAREWLVEQVHAGTGFLMIGGWASFTGLVGGYAGSPIEKLLPVQCVRGDDRIQNGSGAMLEPSEERNTLLKGLSWKNPPVVCGYHRATAKRQTQTVLSFRDLQVQGGQIHLGPAHPALVLGQSGEGRTAAFLTDCAPHWAAGLVDWGKKRITVSPRHGIDVEIGEDYLRFFSRLVTWLIRSGAGN